MFILFIPIIMLILKHISFFSCDALCITSVCPVYFPRGAVIHTDELLGSASVALHLLRNYPANMRRWLKVDLLLSQRR